MIPQLHGLAADRAEAAAFDKPLVFDADPPIVSPSAATGVVAVQADEARLVELLEQGAARVFIGDAVLADPDVIDRLARRYGGSRLGVYARVRRMANHWSFDTVSNADFRIVSPSVCEPAWEVLHSSGEVGITQAQHWLERMARRGAHMVLVQADVRDDSDLNLCAGLVELFGDAVCFAPADDENPRLDEWVRYGQVRRIALPLALYRRREALLTPTDDVQEAA